MFSDTLEGLKDIEANSGEIILISRQASRFPYMCNCSITLAIPVTDREITLPDTGSHDEAYRRALHDRPGLPARQPYDPACRHDSRVEEGIKEPWIREAIEAPY
jgi:hypothetical protein